MKSSTPWKAEACELLLDTHALLWVRGDPDRLKSETRRVPADDDNAVFVSVVSLWEIVVKCRVGNWTRIAMLLPLGWLRPAKFHPHHRDPFDHMIIAQSISEGMTLVTEHRNALLYPVRIFPP
jgi:PIN domain nuclease of toxin-antitoxin system